MSNRTIARLAFFGALVLAVVLGQLVTWTGFALGFVLCALLVLRDRAIMRPMPKGSGTSLNARWWRL